jgi:hypothetical protein
MGAPINTPSTADIWHLSIDDLLAPLPETQRLGGPGPFVINLSASTAPIDIPAKGIAGCERAQVFQVQRIEDRRPRYRLRLGPFLIEDDAEAVLEKVRVIYPSALTATADAEDLRVLAAIRTKSGAPHPHAEKPLVTLTVTAAAAEVIPPISLLALPADPVPSPPSAPSSAASIPTVTMTVPVPVPATVAAPLAASAPKAVVAPRAAVAPIAAAAPRAAVAPIAAAAPRAAVAPIAAAPPRAAVAPIVAAPPRAAVAPIAAAAAKALPGAPVVKSTVLPAGTKPAIPKAPAATGKPVAVAPVQGTVQQIDKPLANLDATQTVRALTQLELEDDQASRWFVIQLALAEDAFDPDTLPNLDIFHAYRLYSVAGIDQGRIVHALRMGFFGEEVGARAVASYLAAYYDNPTIKRVSSAERQRFADQRLEPRKDVGATGKQAVIEITNERFVRERRSTATVSHKSR